MKDSHIVGQLQHAEQAVPALGPRLHALQVASAVRVALAHVQLNLAHALVLLCVGRGLRSSPGRSRA